MRKGKPLRYESDTLGWYVSHEKPENERQYYTLVEPTTAEVLAHDATGRPVLLLNRFGKGRVLSFTFPAEYGLGHMPDAYEKDETYKVYEGFTDLSRLDRPIDCDSPAVELGAFESKTDRVLVVINHTKTPVTTNLRFAGKVARITDFARTKCWEETFPPFRYPFLPAELSCWAWNTLGEDRENHRC